MIDVISTSSRPKGDQVELKGTYSTSPRSYKSKEIKLIWIISSQASSISLLKPEKVSIRQGRQKEYELGQGQREEENQSFGATLSPFCALVWEIEVFLCYCLQLLPYVVSSCIVEVVGDKLMLLLG